MPQPIAKMTFSARCANIIDIFSSTRSVVASPPRISSNCSCSPSGMGPWPSSRHTSASPSTPSSVSACLSIRAASSIVGGAVTPRGAVGIGRGSHGIATPASRNRTGLPFWISCASESQVEPGGTWTSWDTPGRDTRTFQPPHATISLRSTNQSSGFPLHLRHCARSSGRLHREQNQGLHHGHFPFSGKADPQTNRHPHKPHPHWPQARSQSRACRHRSHGRAGSTCRWRQERHWCRRQSPQKGSLT
mmetsp:Transcript_7020/g.15107  ORF Transcript_7020/g.15107 Transcript_7020/m.15107 type:complete len:247 (+) Transcript_7020:387-1127(+)